MVSDTLRNGVGEGGFSGGWLVGVILIGQTRDGTVLRLKDRCPGFTDAADPKPVVKRGSEMQGKKKLDPHDTGCGNCAFRNSILNLTVDTGRGRPGAAIENAGNLLLKHVDIKGYENTERGTGNCFIDDTMGSHPRVRAPQHFWARQLNVEYGRIPLLVNEGGTVWILAMKTEGTFSQLINRGGRLECYALYAMTNPPPDKTMPMIVNEDGTMAVSFVDGGQKSF